MCISGCNKIKIHASPIKLLLPLRRILNTEKYKFGDITFCIYMFSVCISKCHGCKSQNWRFFIDSADKNELFTDMLELNFALKKMSNVYHKRDCNIFRHISLVQLIVLLFCPLFCVLPSQLVLVELDHLG